MSNAAPEPKENMGKPEPRIDGRLKVTGEARYGSDFPVANPAYAFLVTSAIARGRIEAMELSEAKAVPGVLEIFYHANSSELKQIEYRSGGGGPTSSIQDFGPEIKYGGQIIALVAADTFEAAREAAQKVHVTYQAEQPSATFDSSGVSEEDISEKKDVPQAGDAEAAYREAEVKLDAEYETPTQHHNPIELFTTTCAWRDDELTIYEPSQFTYGLKANAAKKMGIDIANVRAVSPFVGGAFGSKAQFSPRTGLVALAARRLNRPVKLVATRDQGFTIQTYRAETRHRIRMGAQRDGKITSFIHEGWEVTSRPDQYSVAGVEDSARLYGFGAVKTRASVVHADRNTPGFMRSPPVVPYIYALESAMDELAIKLNLDPVELRRINDSSADATGKQWSSRSLMKCYDEASERFGWSSRNPQPASMRDPRRSSCRAGAIDGKWQGWCADRRARSWYRRLHRNRPDRRGRARHSLVICLRRARRQQPASCTGRRRVEHNGERVLRRVEGLRGYSCKALCIGADVGRQTFGRQINRRQQRRRATAKSGRKFQSFGCGSNRGVCRISAAERQTRFHQEFVRRHTISDRRFERRQVDVCDRRGIRRSEGSCTDTRDTRAAHRRRFRGRPAHEYPHRP
jgi:hypothetical protein